MNTTEPITTDAAMRALELRAVAHELLEAAGPDPKLERLSRLVDDVFADVANLRLRYLPLEEVQALTGIHPKQMKRLEAAGEIELVRFDGRGAPRVSYPELMRYVGAVEAKQRAAQHPSKMRVEAARLRGRRRAEEIRERLDAADR